jgi:hypothetical protein
MERVVDVTYRGLRVARGAKLAQPGEGEQGFLEVDAPLPVGTRVTVVGEGGFRVEARVVGVVEQDPQKGAPGMRLAFTAAPKVAEVAEVADAGTTLELDLETDAVVDEAGTSGSMATAEDPGAPSAPAGESRAGRRRRKKQNGRP